MSLTFNLTTTVPFNEHVMLLYNNEEDRNNASVKLLNDGLKNGYQCIYASVYADDINSSSNISNLASRIYNCKENIERGELEIVNFKPYYKSALKIDLSPFKKLKTEVEKKLYKRKSEDKKDAIIIVADAACHLSQNKHFDECEILEWWWHETTMEWKRNNQNITVVCPHPGQILNNPLLSETKRHIGSMHTITIDFNYNIENKQQQDYTYTLQKNPKYQYHKNMKRTKRILIVEPEPDIQYLYSLFTRQYGFEESNVNIIKDGNKCLEVIFSAKDNNDNNNNNDYDLIIIDTHLRDISGVEVARKILDRFPQKRIILTTTYSSDNISNIIDSTGIKPGNVILKPFTFDELIALIEER